MTGLNPLQTFSIWALPVLFAITLHEVAHGWVAKQLGDPTAQRLGRLSLNPIKHIDPVGTILIPGILILLQTGFIFGWAKPVPITWSNLRNPRRDMALVALAGPGANLLMAILWALIARSAPYWPSTWLARPLFYMGMAGITINIVLMVLNLLPLPPLDGSRVVAGLLPGRLAWGYSRIEPYGLWILLILVATGGLEWILGPPVMILQRLVFTLSRTG
ncbi:site-2 protease family protein [Acidiferrobacter sp.]|uniref:site-2 protease family protein n=1 Tax=Acidiferrobacter sp. TaxID=1872107 RepID=UPI0026128034|nr:site-2 protease family protein [Acidiferrobacter sp.]